MFSRFRRVAGAFGAAGMLVISMNTAPTSAALVESPNLLVNPSAELGDPSLSGYSSVSVPGWSATGTPTVVRYGTIGRWPLPLSFAAPPFPGFLQFPRPGEGPPGGGAQFFGGGNVASSTLTQTVDLSGAAAQIDTGTVPFTLSGWLGGFLEDPSVAWVTVDFLAADQSRLGGGKIGPVGVFERRFRTALLPRQTSGPIPPGTRSALVAVTFKDCNPSPTHYNNAYADNLSFTVGAALPAPPPPAPPVSKVGALDHVFMIYLENHGVKDILGSRNADYINGLINQYGFGSNYFALTHPSNPNYYAILGGSDFGVNWDCPQDCFDQPNLADNIEKAGKTWAAYEQSMPTPCFTGSQGPYSPGELPFLAFHDIFANAARCQAHVLPLTQMPADLASTATTPNYVWFAADECYNQEGCNDVRFAASQIALHQYNIRAGDQFLAAWLPVILNSPAFKTQRSAIFITWDEDYDNLYLGRGNEGNHVPMIVIPSPNSGMRQGHFVAVNYGNHYSLQRTIEDSLGLPRLTNNDRFAPPMNEYWP
jgi:Phosphoesterase family